MYRHKYNNKIYIFSAGPGARYCFLINDRATPHTLDPPLANTGNENSIKYFPL